MKKAIIILIIIFYSLLLYSEEILKYDDYVKIIQKKLPDLKINNNVVKKQQLEVNKSYSVYDLNSSTKFYGQGTQSYTDNDNSITNYSPSFGAEFKLTNKLPSGTELSTGFTYLQQYTSGETTSANDTEILWDKVNYDPVISVGVTQPLLYNWFGFLDRYGIKNEENLLKIEKLQQELNNENLLADYKKLYFQWIATIYKLELINKTINNTTQQLNQTQKKVNLGLLEKDSLETMNYSLLNYEKQKESYIKDYEYLKNQLSFFIELENYTPEIDYFNQVLLKNYKIELDFINFEDTQNSLILNITKENYDLLKKSKINQVLPNLNLFANVDFNFHYAREVNDGDVYEYRFDDDDSKNVNFKAGIEFSFPLGNISARNSIKEAQIMIDDIILEYERTKKQYDYNISNIIAYHKYLQNVIRINSEAIKSLSTKYSFQLNEYKKGLADLDDLVDTDNSITDERMNEINFKVNLINNIVDYEYLTK